MGGIGLIIATPLLTVVLVLVKTTYLGRSPESLEIWR
jgi:predicted PurR-regulated permease PerM